MISKLTTNMKKLIFTFILLAYTAGHCQKPDLALVNGNIITMKNDKVLLNQTVLITGNKISKIIPSTKWKNTENVKTIDCTGKYIMPTLVDMHMHSNPYMDTYALPFFMKYGVTTIRVMAGNDAIRVKRDSIRTNKLKGLPDIYVASELIDGDPPSFGADHQGPIVTKKEQIIPVIQEQLKKGYDFIKLYSRLKQDVFQEAVAYCKANKIKVTYHIPTDVQKSKFFQNATGEIQHMSGYARFAHAQDSLPKKIMLKNYDVPFDEVSSKSINNEKLKTAVNQTVKNKVWNCPTLVLFYNKTDTIFCKNILKTKIHPGLDGLLGWWQSTGFGNTPELTNYTKFQHQTVALLHKEKAQLLAGTDFPNPWLVPGLSLHQEIERFTVAGLSNFEALKTATVNPAIWFGPTYEKGYVAEDKIADLLILNQNPLTDVKNTTSIYQVIHNGDPYLNQEQK